MKLVMRYYPLLLVIAALLVVVAYRYDEYVLQRDFTLVVTAPCDTSAHSCFISDCSPADNPGCVVGPYEKVKILAREAPRCLEEHSCSSFSCTAYATCSATFCTSNVLEDGESCAPMGSSDAKP